MASNPTTSRLTHLATSILESVAKLEEMLSQQGRPSPSFDEDAPVLSGLPKDTVNVRDLIIDSAAEIQDLLQGPLDIMYRHGSVSSNSLPHPYNSAYCVKCRNAMSLTPSKFNNFVSLQAISRFNIAKLVPAGGHTTFGDIAKQTGLEEHAVHRVLRHAMTMRVFREPEPGLVAHTQASKALVDPVANDWVDCGAHEMWPSATKVVPTLQCFKLGQPKADGLHLKMVDALQKWPGTQEPNETVGVLTSHGSPVE